MFQSYWSYRSSPLISACYQVFNFDRIFISTWYCFLRPRVLHYKKVLVISSVIHRNKTFKSNSKHDNAIKDSQHNICTIVIVLLLLLISLRGQHYEHESEENPTYTSLGMVL